ncbi:MAG TPA: prepilin-type N-terminal cleavage/methylation domain-containing protein [Longimicrobiales bacterium]|nr:prepilin-type N-terminal cleavage/methylation domain-containing protein [Longimicrobiales bacterium]
MNSAFIPNARLSGMRTRGGFTLVEVMVALAITSIIGAAVTSVFITQTRFYDRQEKVSDARSISRGAMNILTSELRMVERTGGVEFASPTKLTVYVPFALGISCGGSGTSLRVRYVPTDPFVLADTAYAGYGVQQDDSTFSYSPPIDPTSNVMPSLGSGGSTCDAAGIKAVPGGGTLSIAVANNPSLVDAGRPVKLYQRVTYEFKASTEVLGRRALWREQHRKPGGEELLAPFTDDARFEFYINDAPDPVPAAPANLAEITGIRIVMNAQSERPDPDGTYPVVPLATSVFFKNRL